MKRTLAKTRTIALVTSLLAGSCVWMGCVSSSEPDRPRRVYRSHHAPPPPPPPPPVDYQPNHYPPPPPTHSHPGPAHPPRDGWVVLGTTVANYEADHDTILIRGRFDNFRQIRFQVTGAPLNLHRLIVTYDDGQPEEIRASQKIKRGALSRVINLHGSRSGLRRIDFYYDTRGFSGQQAEVTVFGRR